VVHSVRKLKANGDTVSPSRNRLQQKEASLKSWYYRD